MSRYIAHSLAKSTKKWLTLLSAITFSISSVAQTISIVPNPPSINAKGHILIDYTTGKVIAHENADSLLAPASLTKMMTSYIIGRELQVGNITNQDMVKISENAWATGNPV